MHTSNLKNVHASNNISANPEILRANCEIAILPPFSPSISVRKFEMLESAAALIVAPRDHRPVIGVLICKEYTWFENDLLISDRIGDSYGLDKRQISARKREPVLQFWIKRRGSYVLGRTWCEPFASYPDLARCKRRKSARLCPKKPGWLFGSNHIPMFPILRLSIPPNPGARVKRREVLLLTNWRV